MNISQEQNDIVQYYVLGLETNINDGCEDWAVQFAENLASTMAVIDVKVIGTRPLSTPVINPNLPTALNNYSNPIRPPPGNAFPNGHQQNNIPGTTLLIPRQAPNQNLGEEERNKWKRDLVDRGFQPAVVQNLVNRSNTWAEILQKIGAKK